MLKIREHAGFDKAHDSHSWWIYDARMTSPKTCPVCMGLDGTHYRGDEIETAFPYHLHMRVNAIKAKVHQFCRCVLRWAGRSKDVMISPIGMRQKVKRPELEKKFKTGVDKMSRSQRRLWWQTTRHARETFRKRRR